MRTHGALGRGDFRGNAFVALWAFPADRTPLNSLQGSLACG